MDKTWKVLLVDDDPIVKDSLNLILPPHWQLVSCQDPHQLPSGHFHAALIDLHFGKTSTQPVGLEIIKKLSAEYPHLEIVAISGDISREVMERCLKNGATRFLAKPFGKEELTGVLSKIETLHLLHLATLRQSKSAYWIGNSPSSLSIKKQVSQFAAESGPILIEGESGTGKEIMVRMLCESYPHQPLISVNVSSISESLFESELFGHTKGAFTGADQNKMGLAEAANNGTLFLDEIEALSLGNQVKLLRFIESNEIRRVGSKQTTKLNVRVLVATNQDLEDLVKKKLFREDLFWRINGKKISLPPLRERKEDISDLAKYFLEQQKPRHNKAFLVETLKFLQTYSWPGNIRELKRITEQAALASPLPLIRIEDVRPYISTSTAPTPAACVDYTRGLKKLVEEFEKNVIQDCLSIQKDVDTVASILQISRSGLYNKIKDYNIDLKTYS